MNNQHSLVIFSYDASRTGAPLLLLSFIAEHRRQFPQKSMKLFLLHGGPVLKDYEALIETKILGSLILRRLRRTRMHSFFSKPLWFGIERIIDKIRLERFKDSHWYVNTFPAFLQFREYGLSPKRVTWHFRELGTSVAHFASLDELCFFAKRVDAIIPDSYAVKNFLLNHGVDEHRMSVVHEYIDISKLPVDKVRRSGKFVIAGSGSPIWRKGFDIFVQTAITYFYRYPEDHVEFHWFGQLNEEIKRNAQHDLEKVGISNKVCLKGLVENPIEAYAQADLFFVTAREEPFGLIVLEAALGRVPALVMEAVGGLNEFVEHKELTVPYMNISEAVEKIKHLTNDARLRSQIGEFYFKKVCKDFNLTQATEKISKIIFADD